MRLSDNHLVNCLKLTAVFLVLSAFFSCSSSNVKKAGSIHFALISNTMGESPYSGLGPKIKLVIKRINDNNPVFLMHLGGMVCAGENWIGIPGIDIERQYREFYSELTELSPIFYTVRAEPDISGNSSGFYKKYTGKKDYYSYNYGNMHFLVLASSAEQPVGKEQVDWIKKDLNQTKNSQAVFVFIHDPLFVPARYRASGIETCMDSDILHKIFTQFSVKAVFSGSAASYFQSEIDGISYINVGCGGFNVNDFNNGYYQYYIADYVNGELKITPGYVSLR